MRLTNKKTLEDGIIIYTSGDKLIDGYMLGGNAVNKLGQLEDIEEELGIDLVTLFKALKTKVYSVLDNRYSLCCLEYMLDKAVLTVGCNHFVELKDYGMTWALTKEELI